MAVRQFSGIIRVHRTRARLETPRTIFTLIPYPQQAALSVKAMEAMGEKLFGYLDGHQAIVEGVPAEDALYNARLAESGLPIEDVRLAPESKDRFALEMEQYFRKDSGEIAAKLNDAGIQTVSALYHRIRNNYEPEVAAFSKYLKVRENRIKELISEIGSNADNRALVAASPRFPVRRGVNLSMLKDLKGVPITKKAPTAPPAFPATAATPTLPSKVDLTRHVTPIKNQGMRSTCVALTAASCLEAELIRKGKATSKLDLSEQYLYWGCKHVDGSPNTQGTFLEYAVEVLLNGVAKKKLAGGVCKEREWPYNRLPVAGNESQDPPTAAALKAFKSKKQYRALNYTRLKHNSIKAIKNALAAGHCVGLSVYTYHFWTDDYAWREGVISLPFNIEPDGAHAICLVGYRDGDATHGDGYFIFKNSWDIQWGYGRPDPGFGSLPYRYVLKEAIEAFTVEA